MTPNRQDLANDLKSINTASEREGVREGKREVDGWGKNRGYDIGFLSAISVYY